MTPTVRYPFSVYESHMISPYRLISRAVRSGLYPVPVITRRYLRKVGQRHKYLMPGPQIGLDLGAGTSPFRRTMITYFELSSYKAVDIAPSENTDLKADICDLPIDDVSVSHVFALDVLQHIPDVQKAFVEIDRVLKPGGLLLISFPFMFGECERVDYWRWSLEGMKRELTARGYRILDARKRGAVFFAFASAIHLAIQLIIPGGRGPWRREVSAWSVIRNAMILLLTIPTATFGWACVGLDKLLPIPTLSGFYQGGFVLARKGA